MINVKSSSLVKSENIVRLLLAVVLATLVLLGACSGGVGSSGTGVPTGSQFGTITGFGSVVVESDTYDETGAQVQLDDDPDAPTAFDAAQLALGMQVVVQFDDDNKASRIRVVPQLIGTVDSAFARLLIVAGQTVIISAENSVRPTIVDGFTDPAGLQGSRVRVFGQYDDNGQLRATRIEQIANASAVLVTGVITAIDPDGVLRMGSLAIRTAARTSIRPASVRPAVGDLVSAYSRSGLTQLGLPADAIVVLNRVTEPGTRFRSGGIIRRSDSNSELLIGPRLVDISSANVTGGLLSELQPGRFVIYAGVQNASGVVADQIRLLPEVSIELQVLGRIDLFDSASRFTVRRAVIDASNASFVGGDARDLNAGVTVLVRGVYTNGTLVATEVRIF